MIALTRRKGPLRLVTAYFAESVAELPPADVAFLFQATKPLGRSRPFRTLHLDLGLDEDRLFGDCSKNNQYKIRRASGRDGLEFETLRRPTAEELGAFAAFYDRFAEGKGLSPCDLPNLQALRAAGGAIVSRVTAGDGEILCQHLYVADGERCRLLHSASHFREVEDSARRSLIGRANRALHWHDIRSSKQEGHRIYDFGGFAIDSPDPVVRRIAEFKASFGGSPVVEHHGAVGLTPLGRLALWLSRARPGSRGFGEASR